MSPSLPRSPHLEPIRRLAKQLLDDHRAHNRAAGERIVQHHSRFAGKSPDEALAEDLSPQDAQLVVARECGQNNWSRLVGVVDLMREVNQMFEVGKPVHVIAKDAEEMGVFEALLSPHYSSNQLGILRDVLPGRNEAVLSRSIRILSDSPILISEYRTLGGTHLLEHVHQPGGPFQVDRLLARTRAVVPTSLQGQRPVLHGVKEEMTQLEFDEVHEMSTRQLCELYDSFIEVNL
jgi:hypothetical protein